LRTFLYFLCVDYLGSSQFGIARPDPVRADLFDMVY
jgi:hypothetical protein